MSSPNPIFATNVVIEIGSDTITYATNIRITKEYEIIRQHILSQATPIIAKTTQRVTFTLENLYIDNKILQKINSDIPQDIKIYPEGKGAGKKVWTLQNALFSSLERNAEPGEFIQESAEGEAEDFIEGTQS
ncbi:MAG: hypothetical protein QXO15_00955 [Nitrososphaerota archaeon]